MVEEIVRVLKTNEKTANYILKLYEIAKNFDDSVELDYREDIVGIGAPDEILRFYFVNRNGSIYAKFKIMRSMVKLDALNLNEAKEMIKNTNLVFKEGDFKRKQPKTQRVVKRINISRVDYLKMLSDGVNPKTGEKLFETNSQIKLALLSIAAFVFKHDRKSSSFMPLASEEEFYNIEKQVGIKKEETEEKLKNVGVAWSEEEDKALLKEFNEGMNIEEIAASHKRTRSAIERRLLRFVSLSNYRK